MNTLGIDTIDAYADGIFLQTTIGEKAVTDYLGKIAEILEDSDLPEIAEQLGKDTADGILHGYEQLSKLMNDGTVPNLAEKYGLVAGESKEAIISIEKFGKVIDDVNKNQIHIPVSIGGGGGDVSIGLRGLVSPHISLKAYASGGLVDSGQIFMARENGIPELVGRYGNQTMVANNGQIVDAIRQAAYEGYKMAIAESGGNRYSGGDTVVNIDGREVFRAVKSAESADGIV